MVKLRTSSLQPLHGMKIKDKHNEVIVRRMLRRVQIVEVDDTDYIVGDRKEKEVWKHKNAGHCCSRKRRTWLPNCRRWKTSRMLRSSGASL